MPWDSLKMQIRSCGLKVDELFLKTMLRYFRLVHMMCRKIGKFSFGSWGGGEPEVNIFFFSGTHILVSNQFQKLRF
jgi:hypothetical protein